MRASICLALLGLLSACVPAGTGAATAQGGSTNGTSNIVQKGAFSGTKQLIGHYIQLTPSCETLGYAAVRVTQPPTNGQVSIEQGEDYPDYKKDNVRFSCDSKKVPAVLLFYTSKPGFVGTDFAVVDAVFADGGLMHREFTISVK